MHGKLTFCALLLACSALAQRSGFGAGFIAGSPTGISLKGWISSDRAIDGALAWNLGHGGTFRMHADYLFHKYGLIQVSKGQLPLYYGPGVRMRFWNDGRYWRKGRWYDDRRSTEVAIRFPVGLCYQFDGAPVDAFIELAPALNLVPATYLDLDGALGLRYWF